MRAKVHRPDEGPGRPLDGSRGGEGWRYLLIPHDAITDNMTIDGLAKSHTVSLPQNGDWVLDGHSIVCDAWFSWQERLTQRIDSSAACWYG